MIQESGVFCPHTIHPSCMVAPWCLLVGTVWPLWEHLQQCSVYDPAKVIFPHSSLVIYFFATSPIKLKLGQQIGGWVGGWVGGGLLITNHLDQSLWWANGEHSSHQKSDHIYYTLSRCITSLLRLLPANATCASLLS